ncbi:MAG: STAS domain-containing protein [Terriglobia bacterium]
MDIRIRSKGNVSILDLNGPLKLGEPEQTYRQQVQELLEGGTKNLAINLAGVPDMDSSGMGALIRTLSTIKQQGGKCRFFGATKRVLQTLKMVRLDSVLELVADEATALEGF